MTVLVQDSTGRLGMGRDDFAYTGWQASNRVLGAAVTWMCLVVSLLLAGCMKSSPDSDQHDPRRHPSAEAGRICGTVGNITMKFPSRYTFHGVTYAGVDYWGGQAHLNDAKWCDDRLLDVPLSVIWPELTPAGGQSWYTSEDPKFITISVGANGAPNPNEAMTQQLEIQAGEGLQAAIPLGRDEIEASKTWSEQVGLYMVEANTFSPANRRRVFWEELTDGSFRVVIVCTINTATGRSRCSQKSFDKERNVWVTINYRAQLLSKWRDLDKSSIELIDSLTIKHKDER